MKYKVNSIIEKPKPVLLGDGLYYGRWQGFKIYIEHFGKHYELETQEEQKGYNLGVIVAVENGLVTFDVLRNSV